jgi:hypothetical protein
MDVAVVQTGPGMGSIYIGGHTNPGLDFNPADAEPALNGSIFVARFATFGAYAGGVATGTRSPSVSGTNDQLLGLGLTSSQNVAVSGMLYINSTGNFGSGPFTFNFVQALNP